MNLTLQRVPKYGTKLAETVQELISIVGKITQEECSHRTPAQQRRLCNLQRKHAVLVKRQRRLEDTITQLKSALE